MKTPVAARITSKASHTAPPVTNTSPTAPVNAMHSAEPKPMSARAVQAPRRSMSQPPGVMQAA